MAKDKQNTQNTNQDSVENANQANTQRLSRSEFIRNNIERKKRTIDENYNAQVFVSDSIAGAQMFSSLRMLDAMDSAIRRLWGNGLDSKDAEKWIKELSEIKNKISALEDFGKEILSKIDNVRAITNYDLRRIIARTIEEKNSVKEEK